ncbi:MAG: hypothetical protein QNJ63_13075 [Calothrix sp. MO_192.B10]|nr:hypothetical protein [Calothrix sp. MO_192.B10]
MGIKELLLPFREEILKIAAKYGAYNVRVFGSVARGLQLKQLKEYLRIYNMRKSLTDLSFHRLLGGVLKVFHCLFYVFSTTQGAET